MSGEGHARGDRVVGVGGGRDRGRARARGCEAGRPSCRPRGLRPPPGAFPRSTRSPAPCSPGWSSRRPASRSSRSGSWRRPTTCAPPGWGRASGRAGRDGAGLEPVRAVGHLEAGLRGAGLEGAAVEGALERGAARSRGERELGRARAVGTGRPGGDGGVRGPGGQRRADREGERARRECGEQHERGDARLPTNGFLPGSRQRSVPIPFEVPNRKYMRFRVFAWTRAAACKQRPGQAWSRKVAFATSGG